MMKECGWLDTKQLYEHNRLLQGPRVFPVFAGRTETIEMTQVLLNSVHLNYSDARFRLPILATQGAPGTGKTDFLDHLALHCIEKDNGTIVCCISFNGRTNERVAMSSEQTEMEMCLLVLYYFFCRDKVMWGKFTAIIDELCNRKTLKLENVFLACLQAAKAKRVFFFIDEISKSYDPATTLSIATGVMRDLEVPETMTPRLRLLVTSLDAKLNMYHESADLFSTASGTKIDWIPLPLLPDSVVFSELTRVTWEEDPVLYQLYRRAGGHPRTLTCVYLAAQEYRQLVPNKPYTYDLLLAKVFVLLKDHALLLDLAVESYFPAFLHQTCKLDGENEPAKMKFRVMVGSGCFVNTSLSDLAVDFVPVASTLQLSHWFAVNRPSFSVLRKDLLILDALFQESSSFLKTEHCYPPIHSTEGLCGNGLEKWHGYYEAFYRLALISQNMKSVNLAELYGCNAMSRIPVAIPKSVYILTPNQKREKIKDFTDLVWNLNVNGPWSSYQYELPGDLNTPAKLWEAGYCCVFILGGSFPGYDIMVVERDLEQRPVYTLVQTKWTQSESSRIDARIVRDELRHARKNFAPFMPPDTDCSLLLPALNSLEIALSTSQISEEVAESSSSSSSSSLSSSLSSAPSLPFPSSLSSSTSRRQMKGSTKCLPMLHHIPPGNVRFVFVTQLSAPQRTRSTGSNHASKDTLQAYKLVDLRKKLKENSLATKGSYKWNKDKCIEVLIKGKECIDDDSREEEADDVTGRGSLGSSNHLLQVYNNLVDGLLIRDRSTLDKLYGDTLLQLLPRPAALDVSSASSSGAPA